jgi:hypothetical protein
MAMKNDKWNMLMSVAMGRVVHKHAFAQIVIHLQPSPFTASKIQA